MLLCQFQGQTFYCSGHILTYEQMKHIYNIYNTIYEKIDQANLKQTNSDWPTENIVFVKIAY